MASEEREDHDELFELARKASIYPKTAHRFSHLEEFVSSVLHLYSEQDLTALFNEFQSLSEEDRKTIFANATEKTSPGYFHLLPHQVDKIKAGRKKMLLHERARLSNVIDGWAGMAWLDLGGAMDAVVELDDHSSEERETRPYVRIYHPEDPARQVDTVNGNLVETIDIIESLRNDAAAVGHPAIAFAIFHWRRVVQAKRVFKRDNVYTAPKTKLKSPSKQRKTSGLFKYLLGGEKEVEIAERNLKAISEALISPKEISRESALLERIAELELDDESSLLRIAWGNLRNDFPGLKSQLAHVEKCLREAERTPRSRSSYLSADEVMAFLKAEGKRFLGYDKDGEYRRLRWVVFKHVFLGWYFGLHPSTVQQYLEDARREGVDLKSVYRPSRARPRTDILRFLTAILTGPLLAAQNPIPLCEHELRERRTLAQLQKAMQIEDLTATAPLSSTAKRG